MSSQLTRRGFSKALALGVAAPSIVPASVFGRTPPSERINVGLIGCGNQSQHDLPGVMHLADTQVVAVSDVNRGSHNYRIPQQFLGREPVRKRVNDYYAKKLGKESYRGCDAYVDFRDVLAREDIDAVMVVTPDHWHALMACMAAKAGKDVYCQKPLSLTVHDAQQMVKAVRKYGTILQTGSQYRSNPVVRRMAELVRNGRIGKVKKVIAIVNASISDRIDSEPSADGATDWRPMPVPDGFDYDRWLGPAPDVPYHVDRCLYRFRFVLAHSGGQITNTGHHSTDIIQWTLGKDRTGPVEYSSRKITASSDEIKNSKIGDDEIRLPVSNNHYRNFIDAVKSREDPIEPVEAGYRTVSICLLGNIAMQLDRKIKWDPAKERIIDDPEASAMLRRPYRAPWSLDEV